MSRVVGQVFYDPTPHVCNPPEMVASLPRGTVWQCLDVVKPTSFWGVPIRCGKYWELRRHFFDDMTWKWCRINAVKAHWRRFAG